ncbi:MAG: OmpA family protein [Pseudomonadota bacterium]
MTKIVFMALAMLSFMHSTHARVPDLPDTDDHPLVSRYSDSALVTQDLQEFDRYNLITGLQGHNRDKMPFREVEGKVTRSTYIAPESATLVTVFRNFEIALKDAGLNILFSCLAPRCDRGSVTSNLMVTSNPDRLSAHYHNIRSIVDFGYIAAQGQFQGRQVSVAIGVGLKDGNGIRYMSAGKMQSRTPTKRVVYAIDVVEKEAMQTGMVTVDAMTKGIEAEGKVVLDGLYFDTDRTTLRPDSEEALSNIAQYLKRSRGLAFFVTGHTDNKGAYSHNLALSKGRAETVKEVLESTYGVRGVKLTAVGVGPVAPIATNSGEKGRSRNRRVELVLQ